MRYVIDATERGSREYIPMRTEFSMTVVLVLETPSDDKALSCRKRTKLSHCWSLDKAKFKNKCKPSSNNLGSTSIFNNHHYSSLSRGVCCVFFNLDYFYL